MAKKELNEHESVTTQLKSYEGYINDIPLVIDPCKMCKVYKEKGGYDTGHFDSNGDWVEGACKMCCWYYDSKFEIGVSDNSCRPCKHYKKITSGKEPCNSCDNGDRWEE